jgi:hypothetical protein
MRGGGEHRDSPGGGSFGVEVILESAWQCSANGRHRSVRLRKCLVTGLYQAQLAPRRVDARQASHPRHDTPALVSAITAR